MKFENITIEYILIEYEVLQMILYIYHFHCCCMLGYNQLGPWGQTSVKS